MNNQLLCRERSNLFTPTILVPSAAAHRFADRFFGQALGGVRAAPAAHLLPSTEPPLPHVIQCAKPSADAIVYLREPADGSHLKLIYRFDDDEPQSRMAAVSPSGHVLRIWNEAEKQAFSHSQRLRIQTKPFVVFNFDLRGIETIASKLKC